MVQTQVGRKMVQEMRCVKVKAGSEVSQKSNSLRKTDWSGLLGEAGEAMLIPNDDGLPFQRS